MTKVRHPNKTDSFQRLRSMGVPIETILDVGVQTGTGELIKVFNDKLHVLLEPIAEYVPQIRKRYSNEGISYELIQVAVSNKNGDVNMRTSSVQEGKAITHARMVDFDGDGDEFRVVRMRTLDSIVAERQLEEPYLLKVDVDGAEIDVLEGAENTLTKCSVICIEAGVKNFFERSTKILSKGFQLFDVIDLCYYDDRLAQMDLVFLSTEVIQKYGLDIFNGGFDPKKWAAYRPITQ